MAAIKCLQRLPTASVVASSISTSRRIGLASQSKLLGSTTPFEHNKLRLSSASITSSARGIRMSSSSTGSGSTVTAIGTPKVYEVLPAACQTLHTAKHKKGISFVELGQATGHDETFIASVFYGAAKPSEEDVKGLAKALDIPAEQLLSELGPGYYPPRGLGPMPPSDPLIYRLYEIVQVFGHPLKAVINEKFGDGIMSAIDFRVNVDKVQEKGSDRVKLTLNGKWLPHTRW